ncbi:MAG TPA: HAMP domain-containing sensor histidine kinase [Candidatus Limnocylindrales bacterium]|nr:HAMP domain-containing sensor histidine kinase [Candidatus Limnocylindrales bacterium]
MFARARRGLAVRYLVLFVIVLIAFSLVFFVALAITLQPDFDIGPEVSNEDIARLAYTRALERIAFTLVFANAIVFAVVGIAGYYLADRTLRPIREAHERQRRFVADASHEMRGPIAAIRGTAESSLLPAADETTRRRGLETILDASARLGRLTTDLLMLARTEQGVLDVAAEPIDLSVVVAEEVERFQAGVTDRRLALDVSLAADLVVHADPAELARIVGNLLDNAVRHGGEPIRVRTFSSDGRAIVEVADRGPGIALADGDRVFEPFYRVRSDASAPEGSGLGLAIAADIARRYGGRLTVESSPGSGARFRLELPRIR